MSGAEIELAGYTPGAIGIAVALMTAEYAATNGFGLAFEAKVAGDMAEFFRRFDPERDYFRSLRRDRRTLGSIAIDSSPGSGVAWLRWFVIAPEARGGGLGRRLLQDALAFCRQRGFAKVYLETLAGLDAAAHLYAECGFQCVETVLTGQWGPPATEHHYELHLARA
jgi:GNAT superfamily N-acetyltransferase